jgi:poly-gamma-glutamate capsule biosynthesis protein CapA/YwtB (metallophosphatase superfamily)
MMKFTASGDALIMDRIPPDHAGFEPIAKYIQRGDARITNLETVISNYDCFASAYCGGIWLNASPDVLDDLIAYGFNMYAWANNHTMDYAYDGLISTKRALESKGLAHAGAGLSLYEAAKPVSLNTRNGRVAMISQCSTFVDAARAGNPNTGIPARPGLNPLRFSIQYVITEEQMKCLKEIAETTGMNGRINISRAQGYTLLPPEGSFAFGGILLREGNNPCKITKPNETDMRRTEESIRSALLVNDYVVVCMHSHEVKGKLDTEPDYFFEEFSHRCIDAGATAILGTGTHQLKGIEIYKGKPIFYSLGNFIFQSDYAERQPADFNERYGFPSNYTAEQGVYERNAGRTRGLHVDPIYFRAIIPYWEMNGNKLVKVELLPIDLGFKLPVGRQGIPIPADPRMVVEELQTVSKAYGTDFQVSGGVIEIKL